MESEDLEVFNLLELIEKIRKAEINLERID